MTDDRTHTMTSAGAWSRADGLAALLRDWAWLAWDGALDRIWLWQDRASQRRRLSEMDDRMLKDIGVTRAEVDMECRKRFWQL